MRRSAAPSQFNPAKRPKFTAPFKDPTATSVTQRSINVLDKIADSVTGVKDVSAAENNVIQTAKIPISNVAKTFRTPLQAATTTAENNDIQTAKLPVSNVAKTFRTPLHAVTTPQQKTKSLTDSEVKAAPTSGNADGDSSLERRYLSVMWCKNSSKKHKKWEGDAILITSGRSVSLLDMEGKEIGKGTGYKSSDLLALNDDETLSVGGKLIQVMSVLTEDQFKSGKCFSAAGSTSTSSDSTARMPVPEKNTGKKFVKPLQDGQACHVVQTTSMPIKPRYDPSIPGALVMPRPSQSHQWQSNKKNLPVIDVVVDPYLSTHLRPHQREGVTFLYECVMGYRDYGGQGAILADDMGLGKTLQCISLLWTLYKQGPYGGKAVVKQALIITPGSLVKNWNQEFKKWLGTERLSVYCVSSEKRVEDFVNTSIYPVLIISYEMFVRVYDIVKQMNFDLVICDEGHRLKNTAIKTTSLIMSLPARRRVILTGTPIQNDLQEFFSIVEFCNPGVLGSSGAFRRVYEGPIVASRQPEATPAEIELGEERGSELSRLTKLFLLRRTQEINNKYLPPKCEIVVFCRPTPLQLRLYSHLLSSRMIRSCLMGKMAGAPHLICIGALKKLCNHPSLLFLKAQEADECVDDLDQDSVYSGLSSLYPDGFLPDNNDPEHSSKLKVLNSLLNDLHQHSPKENIVLVSNHTKTLDILQNFCEACNFEYCRLDGQTPTAKRQDIVSQFNSSYSKHFVFLLSSKAGGVGLNLIGASRLVLYDIDWNPANDLQAMARVWRDGQKKKVYIYRLLSTGTIEEKIYQRQISKQSLSGAVMDSKSKNDVQFSLDDLKDLFSLNERTDCDTHELLSCDCQESREPVREEEPVIRYCQLGVGVKHTKQTKNLGMDELMEWKHVKNSSRFDQNWHLPGASEEISYVFWHESKS
ncbi:DNA repair and recombination protein RAD54B [Mytilus galloprovincialis]|uniref:DNA repair and recombination protein RAD54B n=2 Tax=Mytilus galloprovincialis TaxID=29158 RepID=A0A8B6H8M1_MYTGA|nr:DNA repair and recombination protein RAD54B [Mytilus galloprovincialis]